jgi:type IV pilus assembly protein PilY1
MKRKNPWLQPKRICASALASVLWLQAITPAFATPSQVPGIYQQPPTPNVMFTLDDSGSMTSDAIPDFLADTANMINCSNNGCQTSNALGQNNNTFPGMWRSNTRYWSTTYYRSDNVIARYLRSSAGNPLYYDPTVTYRPWPLASDNTQTMPNADPTRVNIHVSDPTNTGFRRNLTVRIDVNGGPGDSDNQANNFWPATFYVYTGATPLPNARPNNSLNVESSFVKYEIKPAVTNYPRASTRTDCSGTVGATGCTYSEELQNFANWLQYYRSRSLMAKGGVASAFSQQRNNLRVGFTTINTGATVARGVATFEGTARTGFFTSLYATGTPGSTPLRESMDHVGRYFLGGTARGNPWAEDTSRAPTAADACRKSFHIMSTDGFWNGNNAGSPANADNDFFGTAERTPPEPGGATYAYSDSGAPGTLASRLSVNPFRDNNTNNTNTLANVAAYYWKTDLQGSLENRVPSSNRDPAFWQHLTTFTVGLGISGSGQARPADLALSSVDPVSGAYVVSTTTPDTSVFYPYRGKEWLSDANLRDLLVAQRIPMRWPTTTADQATTGDDLVHASMNGRGRYFSATNPTALASGLASALAEASNQDSAYASLGLASTNETSTDNRLYQAIYNPAGWRGRLRAFGLNNGSFSTAVGSELWEVSRAMPAPDDRNIFTWNPNAATPSGSLFTWAGLTATQQAALGPTTGTGSSVAERQRVLDWLRGSSAAEVQNGGPLRDRVRDTATAGVLGDIVGGSPIKGPSAGGGYHRLNNTIASNAAARTTYPLFRAAETSGTDSPIRDMIRTVYFGANDGMLHAVNAQDNPSEAGYVAANQGRERFAFVPNAVFNVPRTFYEGTTSTVKKLYEMSRPDYAHLFTVNAPPQIGDAYINPTVGNSTGWKSVLVSATGAGARNVFALDVTNPVVGSTGDQFNTSKILWEFSEAQSTDMGHIPGYPHIALMRDGTWVAMFGNGYDSQTGRAKLFLLDLATGAVVWEQAVGPVGGNGLSQPNFVLNSNREVEAIYAGDLRGNMWKFDVSSTSRASWNVAFGGNPLFTTEANQPITVMPELELFPNSTQVMVIFGTGKMFDTEDMSTNSAVNVNLRARQAIYGIWDNETTRVTAITQLAQQSIISPAGSFIRTSENPVDFATQRGWYLRLSQFGEAGERVNVNPIIPVKGRNVPVFVVTNTPAADQPCVSGGESKVIALDPITGITPRFSVFDANRDTQVNSSDGRQNGMTFTSGLISSPRFLSSLYSGGIVTEKPGSRGQTGALEGGVEKTDANSRCVNTGRMIAGVSDTSAINEVVRLGQCTPRISWRQIK